MWGNLQSKRKVVLASVVQLNIYRQRDLSVSSHMYGVVYDLQLHVELVAHVGGSLPFLSGCKCPLQMTNQNMFSLFVDCESPKDKKTECYQ